MFTTNPICKVLEQTPSGTRVKELMMNGEDISTVDTFVKYDRLRGLVYFTNDDHHTFIAICDRIDMIEFDV
ncbi:hypothetical protein [Ornithinibacillus californiensis]|jgi:hypothetical protein|uniref:hypothetical protein n=1 Tax=Ornithinibacillus californiensis TaxID=161536 RepID=UPI00064DCF31|nr:hypothetical protein [Ornithinibacillus californiensis]